MINNRNWMRAYCADGRGLEFEDPFPFTFDGSLWDAAANGPALLLVESITGVPAFKNQGPDMTKVIPMLGLDALGPAHSVWLDELRNWAWPSTEEDPRGRLFKRLVNRWLLARSLPPVSGMQVTVRIGAPDMPLLIQSETWRLYLMPMAEDDPNEKLSEFAEECGS